jgi:hypothetical protein
MGKIVLPLASVALVVLPALGLSNSMTKYPGDWSG